MILLIRLILVCIIIYLITRSFARYFAGEEYEKREREQESRKKQKGISKEIGEYVDYEEVD